MLVIAPTNNAKRQIIKSMSDFTTDCLMSGIAVAFRSVASTLGKLPELNDKGQIEFLSSTKETHPFKGYGIVVIEEGSMVAKRDAQALLELAAEKNVFLIIMGDKDQLFPVKEKNCHLFTLEVPFAELTEPMRQKKNSPLPAIVAAAKDAVRNNKVGFDIRDMFPDSIVGDEGQYRVYNDSDDALHQAGRAVKKMIETNEPFLYRTLVYRNATAEKINRVVREKVFGVTNASQDYLETEFLHCNRPVTKKVTLEDGKKVDVIIMDTGTTVRVISRLVNTTEIVLCVGDLADKPEIKSRHNVEISDKGDKFITFKYQSVALQVVDCDSKIPRSINVIASVDKAQYQKDIKLAQQECIKQKKEGNNYWGQYMKLLHLFHDFDYAYTLNAYKVQGWSLKAVGVYLDDIMTIPDSDSVLRAQSVCVSRCIEILFVF
jgi:hypothetical protein